eukprot:GILK01007363.1.p1 GENE.GILK01007363.1~~GILK01007363.1.p1  ORF type:complete len:391 (-),score=18.42 GILK01007363.1:113-1123(-)
MQYGRMPSCGVNGNVYSAFACDHVTKSMVFYANDLKRLITEGCYSYDSYKGWQTVAPCPAHVMCGRLPNVVDFHHPTFCPTDFHFRMPYANTPSAIPLASASLVPPGGSNSGPASAASYAPPQGPSQILSPPFTGLQPPQTGPQYSMYGPPRFQQVNTQPAASTTMRSTTAEAPSLSSSNVGSAPTVTALKSLTSAVQAIIDGMSLVQQPTGGEAVAHAPQDSVSFSRFRHDSSQGGGLGPPRMPEIGTANSPGGQGPSSMPSPSRFEAASAMATPMQPFFSFKEVSTSSSSTPPPPSASANHPRFGSAPTDFTPPVDGMPPIFPTNNEQPPVVVT